MRDLTVSMWELDDIHMPCAGPGGRTHHSPCSWQSRKSERKILNRMPGIARRRRSSCQAVIQKRPAMKGSVPDPAARKHDRVRYSAGATRRVSSPPLLYLKKLYQQPADGGIPDAVCIFTPETRNDSHLDPENYGDDDSCKEVRIEVVG